MGEPDISLPMPTKKLMRGKGQALQWCVAGEQDSRHKLKRGSEQIWKKLLQSEEGEAGEWVGWRGHTVFMLGGLLRSSCIKL